MLLSLEMDQALREKNPLVTGAKCAVFIQCVGSREPERPYCSRVCCTHSVESALKLKEINPEMDVYVLYRDLRTYGLRENIYKEAREKGVIFIRFDLDNKPQVEQDRRRQPDGHGPGPHPGRSPCTCTPSPDPGPRHHRQGHRRSWPRCSRCP